NRWRVAGWAPPGSPRFAGREPSRLARFAVTARGSRPCALRGYVEKGRDRGLLGLLLAARVELLLHRLPHRALPDHRGPVPRPLAARVGEGRADPLPQRPPRAARPRPPPRPRWRHGRAAGRGGGPGQARDRLVHPPGGAHVTGRADLAREVPPGLGSHHPG